MPIKNTQISLSANCSMSVVIVQCSYVFRPYVLAVFGELQVRSMCTAYMTTFATYAVHISVTCNSLKLTNVYGQKM